MVVPPENTYWKNFVAGHDDAFRKLYDCFADRLFSFGSRFCADEETVKDAIHDLFVDLHVYRARLDREVNVKAYLYTSLRRKVLAAMRRSERYRLLDTTTVEFHLSVNQDAETMIMLDERERERLALLAEGLALLTGRQREALYLRFHSGLSYEEAADIMDITATSCRIMVYRAIKQLRANLKHRMSALNLLFVLCTKRP
ncbi:sigma-70 family RNA polymerase sigma factor [Parapedobacter sp. ISTM3]|uniref:RNA polymerase sigma factor n=1 Tax=Parapedobacter sp. ISTM3 TaxID=2800130 RepID=UPI0019073D36|nr:sigma-70 family RNA polymerase sigma factor [Parapedobacter sp. ISTM3]MBK1439117.1 sigma-70 family RNA polymerase sigma factor [Parapedobacter sp. ISTM3]